MLYLELLVITVTLCFSAQALRFDPSYISWNLNTAEDAIDPLDYAGEWEDHDFHPSPDDWRFPLYPRTLHKWVNGGLTHHDSTGTVFANDLHKTQLRHGRDVRSLKN